MVKVLKNGRRSGMISKPTSLINKSEEKKYSFIEATFVTLRSKDMESSSGQMVDTTLENSSTVRCKVKGK